MINFLYIHCCYNWIQLYTLLITTIGISVAIIQLSKYNKTRKADFIYKLDNDFFTVETRIYLILIEIDAIEFIKPENKNDIPYFKLKKDGIDKLSKRDFAIKEFAQKREFEISTFEIDDNLLGVLEKIGIYKKKKIMDLEFTYEIFDYYIQKVYNNKAIIEYIKWIHYEQGKHEIYNKFDLVAKKCKKYEADKSCIYNFFKQLNGVSPECGFCKISEDDISK